MAGAYQAQQDLQQLLIPDTKAAGCKVPLNTVIYSAMKRYSCYGKVNEVPNAVLSCCPFCSYIDTRQVQQDVGSSSSFLQHLMLHAHVEQPTAPAFHLVQAYDAADLSFAQQDTWACEQQGQQFKVSVSIDPQRPLWKLFALGRWILVAIHSCLVVGIIWVHCLHAQLLSRAVLFIAVSNTCLRQIDPNKH